MTLPLPSANLHVVLYEPEIPANTGNIGRLCVGSGAILHIIQPCRFLLTDKALKRAGLDYWEHLDLKLHKDWEEIPRLCPPDRIWLCTTKSSRSYLEPRYQPGDFLVFGPESRGLPQTLLDAHPSQTLTIPMSPNLRSLNLSNAVAIVLFEALRQTIGSRG
ncbi:MAG TPA: tRNA (cytidine(34)-2'-O)-methyltransferase [Candidatus Syntrophosphaera sp.]|jgi:tRNA (cytidine/uridine-2'-O-)-methyltransferase|nr:MAG: tRNA (cytidine(34)-2'-O)-methyltransferase [Candidatus Cloacimonetes bacterium ADurb.Bin117]HOG31203.1 tRNA (cytidine(34)-2'-O)-methyltransferase [Candidatus Cloacimonadota bacterium]HOR02790.1 tRNA (cytidine(34)-2'-O)-methyltransferase [Candidatus Syntrophosphaera sp.]HPB43986.1 tRNA (cytidine(34)-2'-O)-methyltransferase [Candidatus Syntrophosphaera sp.]HPK82525.1 tRNA (cytidine(34)-2'-O)-methyltransferase [Candidatus Syntrophosphaera sp.]